MLQSETPSLHKTKTAKSEPKLSLIMADLKPVLACYNLLSTFTIKWFFLLIKKT